MRGFRWFFPFSLAQGSQPRAKDKTVETALTESGDDTCDILVPTLRVGAHVWDALRPDDSHARRSPNDAERRRRRSHAGLVQARDCLGNPVGTRPRDQTSPKRQRGFRLRWLSSPAHPPGASKSGWHPLVDMLNGLPAPSSLYSRCAESEKSLTQNLQFVDFFVATSYATKRKKKWKIFRAVRRFRPGGGRICSSWPDVPTLGGRSVAAGWPGLGS